MRYGVIDIGTGSMKTLVYDDQLNFKFLEKVPNRSILTQEGYVEQDPNYIWSFIEHSIKKFLSIGIKIAGISTYRASIIVWSSDGKPLTNIITWLDPRGREVFSKPLYRLYSMLPVIGRVIRPDAPVLKIKWILDKYPNLYRSVDKGEVFIGTLSSYIAYRISNRYINDPTNEALTGLIHPKNLRKIDLIYYLLKIPKSIGSYIIDNAESIGSINNVDVATLIADQQASMIGSSCINPGCVKITGGTGIFIDIAIDKFMLPPRGMIPIVLYRIKNNTRYGVEAYIPDGGSVVEWLLKIGVIESFSDIDKYVENSKNPLYIVPSFSGMNFPVKRKHSTGLIYGISLNTSKMDLVRGFVEGIVVNICEHIKSLSRVVMYPKVVRVDGGLSKSLSFLKLLSTACGIRVERVAGGDATSRGVAMLLSLYEGRLKIRDLDKMANIDLEIDPGEGELNIDRDVWRRILKWVV